MADEIKASSSPPHRPLRRRRHRQHLPAAIYTATALLAVSTSGSLKPASAQPPADSAAFVGEQEDPRHDDTVAAVAPLAFADGNSQGDARTDGVYIKTRGLDDDSSPPPPPLPPETASASTSSSARHWGTAAPGQKQQRPPSADTAAGADHNSSDRAAGSTGPSATAAFVADDAAQTVASDAGGGGDHKPTPKKGGFAASAKTEMAPSSPTVSSTSPSANRINRTVAASLGEAKKKRKYVPPDGFRLAARIVTIDGLSHFIDTTQQDGEEDHEAVAPDDHLTVPFLDCSAIGSFTESIRMNDCSFRHLPAGTEPVDWMTLDEASGPQVVVALQPLEVTVSGGSGEDGRSETRKTFKSGDTLLFEDIGGRGHKMRSVPASLISSDPSFKATHQHGMGGIHSDMSVLIISLPRQNQYQHNQQKTSGSLTNLSSLFGRWSKGSSGAKEGDNEELPPRPCLVETDGTYSSLGPAPRNLGNVLPSKARLIRATVGAALSAVLTHRLLSQMPIGVAACVGGGALLVAGTCGFSAVGEGTLDSVADWWEGFILERRLASAAFLNGDFEESGFEEAAEGDLPSGRAPPDSYAM